MRLFDKYAAMIPIFIFVVILTSGCGSKEITTESGLKYTDVKEGTGPSPVKGKTVMVNYIGTLENGQVFESSIDKNKPYSFVIGTGQVIPGWEEGILTMKVGGRRRLTIPPNLAWGKDGSGIIPPNATVIFDVELLEVK